MATPNRTRNRTFAKQLQRYQKTLLGDSFVDFYMCQLINYWGEFETPPWDEFESMPTFHEITEVKGLDYYQIMSFIDLLTYLPDDVLVKVDRASMAVGLEVRVPILDHQIVELASAFPTTLKRFDGRGKWVMRQVLKQYIPQTLFDNGKKGFAVPIGNWLRGPLYSWAGDLLSNSASRNNEFFDSKKAMRMLNQHRLQEDDWSTALWGTLMLSSWLQKRE